MKKSGFYALLQKNKNTRLHASGAVVPVTPSDGKRLSLAEMQAIVGGYVECIPLLHGMTMWLNEEGKIHNLPLNSVATRLFQQANGLHDVIVGDVIIITKGGVK